MTLQELVIDLNAAGANKNTIQLAINCYELGKAEATRAEQEACAKVCDELMYASQAAIAIRARNKND